MSGKGRAKARMPDLGQLDICLNVRSVDRSVEFYRTLGYRRIGGVPKKGWAILERDGVRVGLFHGFIKNNILNFRGGDIGALLGALRAADLSPYDVKLVGKSGAGRFMLKDPDGNGIFFDTTPKERTARKRARARR